MERRILERIEYGKKSIREHTNPGDLIAFEHPEEFSFAQNKKLWEAATHQQMTPEIEHALRNKWKKVLYLHLNMYSRLAAYAESIGRRVLSLEPSARKPNSALRIACEKEQAGTPRSDRINHLLKYRPNISFLRRIQRHKPKMVVVANGHAIYLEHILKMPRDRTDYIPDMPWSRRAETFAKRELYLPRTVQN